MNLDETIREALSKAKPVSDFSDNTSAKQQDNRQENHFKMRSDHSIQLTGNRIHLNNCHCKMNIGLFHWLGIGIVGVLFFLFFQLR